MVSVEGAQPINSNRRVPLLIAGLPLLIIAASTLLWFAVERGQIDLLSMLGTANHGTLIQPPLSLQESVLLDQTGSQVRLQPGSEGVWSLLIPGTPDCDTQCQQTLYYTRQIRAAMGKFQPRIKRLYLLPGKPTESAELSAQLRDAHPGLKVLYTPATSYQALFDTLAENGDPPSYYLVDPMGWVMMYYTDGAHYKDVMADLKFLLNNSGG